MSGSARGGSDWLDGGPGNDALYGDCGLMHDNTVGGADVFVFAPGSGLDTIPDFEQGKDLLDVRGYGAHSLADLTITASVIDLDGAAVDNAGNEVAVLNVANLVSGDFLFA